MRCVPILILALAALSAAVPAAACDVAPAAACYAAPVDFSALRTVTVQYQPQTTFAAVPYTTAVTPYSGYPSAALLRTAAAVSTPNVAIQYTVPQSFARTLVAAPYGAPVAAFAYPRAAVAAPYGAPVVAVAKSAGHQKAFVAAAPHGVSAVAVSGGRAVSASAARGGGGVAVAAGNASASGGRVAIAKTKRNGTSIAKAR